MKLSELLLPTLKEVPAEAETDSHKLMLRAGLMRKLASGIYSYLPLGWKAIRKAEEIVRREMDAIGGQELLLPALHPAELWQESGRWSVMGETMFRLKDRHQRDFCLGMTHEEVITDLARRELKSYRQLPVMLYQIQTKFRDETRPRAGIIRAREFIMKDAYSFHRTREDLQKTYDRAYEAYTTIFRRCGLSARAILADPGPMGGSGCHEFAVLCDAGEDTVFTCACGYGANGEVATFRDPEAPPAPAGDPGAAPSRVDTPNVRTIKELTSFLKASPKRFIKTLVYEADGSPVVALVRGDREISELKLRKVLGAKTVALASNAVIEQVTGAPVGFAGPVGLNGASIVADHEVMAIANGITGANEVDAHLTGVFPGRHFTPKQVAQIRMTEAGDLCSLCGAPLAMARGIEVGHIFQLGTKYSADMHAHFLDEDSQEKPFIMGCYGIGVTRIVATAIETRHDKDGIIWPMSLAPYQVIVIPVLATNGDHMALAETLYRECLAAGVEAVLDDRDLRPGVKFKDADLVGFPIRLVVGDKAIQEGSVELKRRDRKETAFITRDQTVAEVQRIIAEELAALNVPDSSQ